MWSRWPVGSMRSATSTINATCWRSVRGSSSHWQGHPTHLTVLLNQKGYHFNSTLTTLNGNGTIVSGDRRIEIASDKRNEAPRFDFGSGVRKCWRRIHRLQADDRWVFVVSNHMLSYLLQFEGTCMVLLYGGGSSGSVTIECSSATRILWSLQHECFS
jgi:hypothetical protein